ncbi:hypothetical protein HYV82_05985 [Candidatus Woesearchaeota archaeon]|nr:hypothetical protein [Candidatus Woesearchaeota archaeon]
MAIIEYHKGCNAYPPGCFGPDDNFYTVFGTELRFLTGHIITALILGIALFGVLFFLNKKGILRVPIYLALMASVAAATLSFFALAYFFPARVLY